MDQWGLWICRRSCTAMNWCAFFTDALWILPCSVNPISMMIAFANLPYTQCCGAHYSFNHSPSRSNTIVMMTCPASRHYHKNSSGFDTSETWYSEQGQVYLSYGAASLVSDRFLVPTNHVSVFLEWCARCCKVQTTSANPIWPYKYMLDTI